MYLKTLLLGIYTNHAKITFNPFIVETLVLFKL